jgi:hypothetical protein
MRKGIIATTFALILIVIFSLCCLKDSEREKPSIRFPYLWLDVQGYGGDIDKHKIPEPSGLCFHKKRNSIFVVSDEGWLYEMDTDGFSHGEWRIPGDLEAVTVNPATGLVYIIVEGDDIILEFDPESERISRRFPICREFQGDRNFLKKSEGYDNGVESITFVAQESHPEGGTFYIGNQWDPSFIAELLVPLNSGGPVSAEAKIIRVLPFHIDDPSAMCYDCSTGLLNVVSDADNILVELTLDGILVAEYAFLADNQEGITWDSEKNLYIAQDNGGIIKVKDLR